MPDSMVPGTAQDAPNTSLRDEQNSHSLMSCADPMTNTLKVLYDPDKVVSHHQSGTMKNGCPGEIRKLYATYIVEHYTIGEPSIKSRRKG